MYIFISVVALLIAGWLAYTQSSNKNKLLAILICIWIFANTFTRINDYLSNRPEPIIIIDQIEEHFDKRPPTYVEFIVKIRNTGDSYATNIVSNPTVYLNGEEIFDDTFKHNEIRIYPGQVMKITRMSFSDDLFKEIWDENNNLRLEIELTYSDEEGRKYGPFIKKAKYKPYLNKPVVVPGWSIIKN